MGAEGVRAEKGLTGELAMVGFGGLVGRNRKGGATIG